MGLNREYIGREYDPIIHTVTEQEIKEYVAEVKRNRGEKFL
jgi:hypothetical protein